MLKLKTEIFPNNNIFPLLQHIQKLSEFNNFYLAGGTALALYLGHRQSIDLDFFSAKEFAANKIDSLQMNYQALLLNKNAIEVVVDEVKLMFMYFAFPAYRPLQVIDGLRFADPVDIGLMKLLALQGRTTRKDIVDLYFIDKEIMPLLKLLNLFEKHYPKESFNAYASFKQLLNISEIETTPMPVMLKEVNWEEMWGAVSKNVTKHIQGLLAKE